jgi:hypothetical protein
MLKYKAFVDDRGIKQRENDYRFKSFLNLRSRTKSRPKICY